jgi:tripartite-type tricarboxylate transporter receptor subunit TctC
MRAFSALVLCCSLLVSGCDNTSDSSSADINPDAFPSRPLRVIIPFGAGGLADVTMRLAGEELGNILGQPVVIENRPGAGGVAATSTMLNADADGHTLIVLTNGTTIAMSQFPEQLAPVNTDLQPVSSLAWFDLVLLTNPGSGLISLQAVLDKAASDAQGVKIGVINPGSSQHLSAELFKVNAGINATIISYRTTPDVLSALLRQEVDVMIDAYTALKGSIESGQALPVAVTGEVRNPAMPDVPTAEEAGVAGYVVTGWNALYTNKGVPSPIVTKLHDAIAEVAAMPEIGRRFLDLGVEARANTPDEMNARFEEDRARWHAVMLETGVIEQ